MNELCRSDRDVTVENQAVEMVKAIHLEMKHPGLVPFPGTAMQL